MDISGLVKISIGMIFLWPRFRTTHILAGNMWIYIYWIGTTKFITAVTSKSGAGLQSFTLYAIFVPNVEVFVMEHHIYPNGRFMKLWVIRILNAKYMLVFVYIWGFWYFKVCHILMPTPYPAVKLSRQSLLHAWKKFCVDKCCHF